MSHLNRHFDAIFLINLKRRTDRLALSRFYLDRLGIKYIVLNAVDGTEHKPLYRRLKRQEESGRLYGLTSPGALGLLKTWQKLLSRAKKRQYKRVLILEDDFIPAKEFHKEVEKLDKVLKDPLLQNYKAMYLGCNKQNWKPDKGLKLPKGDNWFVPDTNLIYGTFAVALQDQDGFFDEILGLIKGYKGGIDTYVLNSLRLKDLETISNTKTTRRGKHPKSSVKGKSLPKYGAQWIVICPNLFIADVSDSDNMAPRDFETFAISRQWDFSQYDRLPLQTFCRLRSKIIKKGVNLRHLLGGAQNFLSKEDILNCLKISFHGWNESGDKIVNLFDEFLKSFISLSFLEEIKAHTDPLINKYDLYRLLGTSTQETKPFVFIIPSYNNEKWITKNLGSVLYQDYTNFRIIYLEDGSTDKTYQAAQKWLEKHPEMRGRMQILRITGNQGPAASRYIGYHLCDDDEIAVLLDGDDWLQNPGVLTTLNQYYQKEKVFVTYGSFAIWDGKNLTRLSDPVGVAPFREQTIIDRDYRSPKTPWRSVHLRTAYIRLLRKIKIQDLWDSTGRFYRVSTDRAEMFPVLEMAGTRHCNIPEPLYVYNKENSQAFATSYFRTKNADNPWAQYRIEANERISLGERYTVRQWKTCEKVHSKPAKLPKLLLLRETDKNGDNNDDNNNDDNNNHNNNNDEIIIDLNFKEQNMGSSLTSDYVTCRLPNEDIMKKTFNYEGGLSMNESRLIKMTQSYSKILLNYRGAEGFLFLFDPFIEKASNLVMPSHEGGIRCFGSGFEILGNSLGIIAGEVRFLKPEYRRTWRQLPGMFLNDSKLDSTALQKDNAVNKSGEADTEADTDTDAKSIDSKDAEAFYVILALTKLKDSSDIK